MSKGVDRRTIGEALVISITAVVTATISCSGHTDAPEKVEEVEQALCPAFLPAACGGATWPGGTIPFLIDPALPAQQQQIVMNGMNAWQNRVGAGVIQFVQRTNEQHFLTFTNGPGCGAAQRSAQQPIFPAMGCTPKLVLHELGHVIGYEHGQQRNERDRFLRLAGIGSFQCSGSQEGGIDTVTKCRSPWSDPTGRPGNELGVYNFDSLMLYDSFGVPGPTNACGLPEDSPVGDRGYVRRGLQNVGVGRPCENDIIPPWSPFSAEIATVDLSDASGVVELYRSWNGWQPFKSMGRHINSTSPLNIEFGTGVTLDGEPSVASLGPRHLRVFARGTDGNIWQIGSYESSNTTVWGPWENLSLPPGTGSTSDPAGVSWTQDITRIDVVSVRNATVFKRAYHSGGWEGAWSTIGSPSIGAQSAPAISSSAPDKLHVYVIAVDASTGTSQAWWRDWTGSAWTTWNKLANLPAGVVAVSAPSATARDANHRDVVVRGSDGALYYIANHFETWDTNWTQIGSPGGSGVGRPAISSWGKERVDVFVTGVTAGALNQYLWHTGCAATQCSIASAWTAFVELGGVLVGSPTAASPRSIDRIDVIAAMTDGTALPQRSTERGLWHKTWPWWNACQLAADFYGVSGSLGGAYNWGFAPQAVRAWWASSSCTEFARTTTAEQCQNMSTLYGASVTLAEPVSYSWWIQNGCAVNPQCQGISDLFGTVANVTWGYAPDYVRSWWVSANCTTVPANRFEICHRAADTFGIVSGVTWGYAPDYVRAWWIDNQCQLQF